MERKNSISKLSRRDLLLFLGGGLAGIVVSRYTSQVEIPKISLSQLLPHQDKKLLLSYGTMVDTRDRLHPGNLPSDQEISALFDKVVEGHATHVDINTPYDSEFRSVLRKWVTLAHDKNLNVILRGNFARTEGWYEEQIPQSAYFTSPTDHIHATAQFLEEELSANPRFLRPGDFFNPAPEPENARRLIGDYWQGGKSVFREYVRGLYHVSRDTLDKFQLPEVNIIFGHNADVALDQEESFWQELGGVVGIDNNVATVAEMDQWCKKAKAKFPHTQIIMLEYGAPTDRTGELDATGQALFITGLLQAMKENDIDGYNYQTIHGGTTSLLIRQENNFGVTFTPKEAFMVVSDFYDTLRKTADLWDNSSHVTS